MADHSIGIKVELDERAAKQLQALPEDLRQRFGRLRQELAQMGGQAGQVGTQALSRVGGLAVEAFGAGRAAPEQLKAIKADLDTVTKALQAGFQDRVKSVRDARAALTKEVEGLWEQWEKANLRGQHRVTASLAGQAQVRFQELLALPGREREMQARLREARQEARAALMGIELGVGGLPSQAASPGVPPEIPGSGALAGMLLGRGFFGQFWRGLIGVGMLGGFGYYAAGRFRETRGREPSVYDLARGMGFPEELGTREGFLGFKRMVHGAEMPLVGLEESQRLFGAFAGIAGGRAARALAPQAGMLGLGFGVGPVEGAQFFAQLHRLGATRGTEDQQRLALELADAIAQGRMRGREGEVFSALLDFLRMAMSRMAVAPSPFEALALQTRLVAGAPPELRAGARGELGMRVLGAAQGALSGVQLLPGLPNLMEPILLSIMGRERVPLDQMQAIVERGLFGVLPSGQPLFEAVTQQLKAMGLEGSPEGRLIKARMFNIPMGQFPLLEGLERTPGVAKLLGAIPGNLLAGVKPERIGELAAVAERYAEVGVQGLVRGRGAGPTGAAEATLEEFLAAVRKAIEPTEREVEIQQRAAAERGKRTEEALEPLVPAVNRVEDAFAGLLKRVGQTEQAFAGLLQRMGFSDAAIGAVELGALGAAAAVGAYGLGKSVGGAIQLGGRLLRGSGGASSEEFVRQFPWARHLRLLGPTGAILSDLVFPREAGETPEEMEEIRRSGPYRHLAPGSSYDDVDAAIRRAAETTGVDPALLRAIWRAEGGDRPRTRAFGVQKGGVGLEEQAMNSAWIVRREMRAYKERTGRPAADPGGSLTPAFLEHLAGVYAPVGAENDPTGLNRYWLRHVRRFYRGGGPAEAAEVPSTMSPEAEAARRELSLRIGFEPMTVIHRYPDGHTEVERIEPEVKEQPRIDSRDPLYLETDSPRAAGARR